MEEENISVILFPSKKDPFLVIKKRRGVPSAPLFENDKSALTSALSLFPFLSEVHGRKEIEKGLLHRLDTETEGLLLIASTQESFDFLLNAQKEGKFIKGYSALLQKTDTSVLGGFPVSPFSMGEIEKGESLLVSSFFRNYSTKGSQVRPVTENSSKVILKKSGEKLYSTEIIFKDNLHAFCKIKEGFRHQVRCHLAWLGFPVKGDRLYNPLFKEGESLCFKADFLSFPHPLTGEKVEIRLT